ncbi:MAG: hypothetical protein QM760_06590 [Nibricoccus sp.]
MPSSISFLPAPAPAAAPSTPASDLPSGEPGKSFDSVLNKAAPSSGKCAGLKTSVTGSSRGSAETAKSAKNEKAEKTSEDSRVRGHIFSDTAPSLLSAEELAAMLALMGAPVATQQPPPPALSTDLALTGDACVSDSGDVAIEGGADFSAPQFAAGKDKGPLAADADSIQETTVEPAFALATDSAASAGLNARDLLKQGVEVIEYQLQPAVGDEVATVAPSEFAAADQAAAAVTTPEASKAALSSDDTLAQASAAAQQASASNAQPVEATSRRFSAPKNTSKTGSEKIAAAADSRESLMASGVKTSIHQGKNNFLNVENKEVTSEHASVGTSAANWGDSMNSDARSTPFAARVIDGAFSLPATSSAGAATMDRSAETSKPAASATQAAQIVSEIRDIADGLWAVERNSVEVRFNYSPTERLSVKVEYRDGVVQTTFRTDSHELRDTIAREWQTQVAAASDARPYRVADPVFNTPPADARGFSLGGDASRQQRQAEQSGNTSHTFATTSGRGLPSSSVAAAPVTVSSRPDTALHLHAFA